MTEVNGQWYIFYHRQTNLQKCCRQGCVEKLTALSDGSILQAELTSCGLNDGPLSGTGIYEARIACNLGCREPHFAYVKVRHREKTHPYFTQSGMDREDKPDQYIANMQDGAWAGFKYFSFDGENHISVRVRGTGKGKLKVATSLNGESVAVITVEESNEWQVYDAKM